MTVIECKDISMRFGEQVVLQNVNLTFTSGQIYGITGRNGSGKTVLLKIICGLLSPSAGTVFINGQSLASLDRTSLGIGALIERPGFLGQYSGFKNLRLLARIKNTANKESIVHAMESVGLDHRLKKKVAAYSLGMKQRLGIAQAIMESPDIILLDEPLNAIDTKGVADIRKLLLEQKKAGKLIILCSHIQADNEILADRTINIMEGHVGKDVMGACAGSEAEKALP